MAFKSVSPTAKKLAEGANRLTGGDEVTPGAVDVSPETLEHVAGFLFGGLGRFAYQAEAMGERAVRGEDQPIRETPLLRRFLYEGHPSETNVKYRDLIAEFDQLGARQKFYQQRGDRQKLATLPRPLLHAKGRVDQIEREITSIRKALKDRRIREESAEKRIRDLQLRALRVGEAARRAPGAAL
jgi:hypothetical protein